MEKDKTPPLSEVRKTEEKVTAFLGVSAMGSISSTEENT